MSLIVMAVYDTEENGRVKYTERCLGSLYATINLLKHRVCLVDNASCAEAKDLLRTYVGRFPEATTLITNDTNLGTAKAVNKGIKLRQPGEHVVKMDNDVVFGRHGWADEMEEVLNRMPNIGILGLKRKDLGESPYSIDTEMRSQLLEVNHQPGEPWYVFEKCKMVMGTCTMLNHLLLDKVGYFYQMDGLYGWDDCLLCTRSEVAGFINGFHHGVQIDHIDPGGGTYMEWKAKYAGALLGRFAEEQRLYLTGAKSVYHED